MVFQVRTSAEAELDAITILEWLLERNAGKAGLRWFLKMEDAISSLANLPERWPVAPESPQYPFEVRHLLYGQKPHLYRVLFRIEGDIVTVLHIRHGRRTHTGEPH